MNDSVESYRRLVGGVLIAITVGLAAGRILAATRVYEPAHPGGWPSARPRPMPTYSSNDRSRWATIWTLVDKGTYVVGERNKRAVLLSAVTEFAASNPLEDSVLSVAGYRERISNENNTGAIFEEGFGSVDKVLNPDTLEFYSTKPPLLSTLIAGLYWILRALTGWNMGEHPNEVVRTLLLFINALPFLIYLVVLGRWIDRYGRTEWGKLFVFATACFATHVCQFLNSLNNHTFGTFSVLFALGSVLRIWDKKQQAAATGQPLRGVWYHFALAGLFGAFAVVNELPALSFFAAIFVLLLVWSPGRTLLFFVPPAALLAFGFFYTNYLAIGQWEPAYAEFGGPWYRYEGSHWRRPDAATKNYGIDFARFKETRGEYAMHLLVGHHGFFSLTPVWLLAFVGMFACCAKVLTRGKSVAVSPPPAMAPPAIAPPATAPADSDHRQSACQAMPWFLAPMTLSIALVVVAFYLVKSDNYGGWSIGPRWLIWLSPLLLLCMLPAVDWLASRRWGRALGLVLAAFSALSAQYPGWNPWRQPWIYDLMDHVGWIPY